MQSTYLIKIIKYNLWKLYFDENLNLTFFCKSWWTMVLKNLLFKIPGSWCLSRHFFTTYKTWLTFQVAWIYAMIFKKNVTSSPTTTSLEIIKNLFGSSFFMLMNLYIFSLIIFFLGVIHKLRWRGEWWTSYIYELWSWRWLQLKTGFFISDLAKLFNLKVAIFQWYHFSVCFFWRKDFLKSDFKK